jgi:pimeloyl-ACP methyl ester carboxylesterase
MDMCIDAYVGLFASLGEHFKAETLVQGLPKVTSPVLFVSGTRSPIPHVESERSAALIPGARVELAPLGHFPWLEDPGWLTTCIAGFLER